MLSQISTVSRFVLYRFQEEFHEKILLNILNVNLNFRKESLLGQAKNRVIEKDGRDLKPL